MKRFLLSICTINILLVTAVTLLVLSGNIYPGIDKNDLVKDYLNAIESGDRKAIMDFINTRFDSVFLKRLPLDIHTAFQKQYYYMSAGLGYNFIDSVSSSKNEAKALIKNKLTGAYLELRIPLTENTPQKINNFVEIKVVSRPAGSAAQENLNNYDMVKRLQKCMDLLVQSDEFSGAVMFAQKGKPLFKRAYGMSNKGDQILNRTDTKFNIASVGKVFTGIAIAQLVQQGKISFDDPLDKYLPEDWLNPELSKKIKIKHLLTHTSGLGDYFSKLYNQNDRFIFRDLDDYKILLKDQTLQSEPGTKWSYSNTGMLLLGVIIERVTGKKYFDYLNDNIFDLSEMKNTGGYDKDSPVPNRSLGYLKEYADTGITWKDNSITRVVKGSPSGGCYSTIEDLLSFDTALKSYKLLSKEYTDLVLSPKPEINSPFYGYGFFIERSNAGTVIRHSGDGTGISCQYSSYLESGYTVIVLANYNRPAADIVYNVLNQMLVSKY